LTFYFPTENDSRRFAHEATFAESDRRDWRARTGATLRSLLTGLQADIIALDGDPLKDITALMKGGIVYKNSARAIPVYARGRL
jgi:hypothetical protein